MDEPAACLECKKEGRDTTAWLGFGRSVSAPKVGRYLICALDERASDRDWTCNLGHRVRGGQLALDLAAACALVGIPIGEEPPLANNVNGGSDVPS